ncbi:hypothetical protein NHF50_07790 [Flavobacterium sp. NRK F10]|uniref:hypothetical protein n=1 Tax=Flavobacterium TaxID=237 RepID=UPI0011B2189C|nr:MULTISPECIES: hypothetical protein [Flavobacterium]MCO6174947.1 hypothetical protein [Flavobacterium sp. NRK F10]
MKTLFKILTLLLISLNVQCQTVTTVVPYRTLDYPNGAYLKDLDNEFPFWLGTWEGTADNKKYTFTFVLFEQHLITFPNGEYEFKDKVVGKLKVTDLATNQVIYDESSFANFDDYIIKGNVIYGREFYFGFYDKENHCNNSADFTLVRYDNNPNQILYKNFSYDEYWYWDCSYTDQLDIPMFLPKVDLMLTRQ